MQTSRLAFVGRSWLVKHPVDEPDIDHLCAALRRHGRLAASMDLGLGLQLGSWALLCFKKISRHGFAQRSRVGAAHERLILPCLTRCTSTRLAVCFHQSKSWRARLEGGSCWQPALTTTLIGMGTLLHVAVLVWATVCHAVRVTRSRV